MIKKVCNQIKNFINNDPRLKRSFNHHNRKYSIDDLLPPIIDILRQGISYRSVKSTIHWSTIYKFFQKLVDNNVISDNYHDLINRYINRIGVVDPRIGVIGRPTIGYVDSSFVCNKLGEDFVAHNTQIPKHKTCKFSVISDQFDIPLSIITVILVQFMTPLFYVSN